jgi:hypothetical protein
MVGRFQGAMGSSRGIHRKSCENTLIRGGVCMCVFVCVYRIYIYIYI